MTSPSSYVIEFRNGRYFVDLDASNSGPLSRAMRFATEQEAKSAMLSNTWMLYHGALVVPLYEVAA